MRISASIEEIGDQFVKRCGYGAPGAYACITISDTGTGMDEETKRRVFEPFYTTKQLGKGTGLGMAIVYGIVKQHNGFIRVQSEPQVGTTFHIYLPLINEEREGDGNAAIEAPPRGGTDTVLLAEDEAAVRNLVEEILTGSGYRVILAEDGKDAVAKFKANRDQIKLILMDMIMPKMSGKEACDKIRKLGTDVRVIYTSGYTMDAILNHDVLDEGAELIMKPIHPLELLRKVRETLDR